MTIIAAAPKESIERALGAPLTDTEYRIHVLARNRLNPNEVVELPADWTAPPDWNHGIGWALRHGEIVKA